MARLPPTTQEQRLELLEDTESLITPGFLSERITVGDLTFNIRSPFPSDYFLLENAFSVQKDAVAQRNWSIAMVARLVWLIDGFPYFNTPGKELMFREVLNSLPRGAFDALFYCVLGLIRRMSKAQENILYFLFEDRSRDLWRGLGSGPPNLDTLTGMTGLEGLGLNASQKVWLAWNYAEDQRIRDEFNWTLTKQTIAPHAPKAVERMNKQEKQKEELRLQDRAKKSDEWYYKATGVLDEDGKLITKDGSVVDPYVGDQVSMAYTSDELADEMRRWVTGDMDFHDKVVAEYKDQIKERMLQERSARDQAMAEAQQEIREREENLGTRPRTRLVGYTGDQVAQMMQEGGFDADRPGARTVSYPTSRKQAAFDKWVDSEKDAGALVEEDGKLVARKEIPKPKKDDRNLQDKITSRLPRYSGGD